MVHANKQCPLFVQCRPHFKHGLIMSGIATAYRQELAQFVLMLGTVREKNDTQKI